MESKYAISPFIIDSGFWVQDLIKLLVWYLLYSLDFAFCFESCLICFFHKWEFYFCFWVVKAWGHTMCSCLIVLYCPYCTTIVQFWCILFNLISAVYLCCTLPEDLFACSYFSIMKMFTCFTKTCSIPWLYVVIFSFLTYWMLVTFSPFLVISSITACIL